MSHEVFKSFPGSKNYFPKIFVAAKFCHKPQLCTVSVPHYYTVIQHLACLIY